MLSKFGHVLANLKTKYQEEYGIAKHVERRSVTFKNVFGVAQNQLLLKREKVLLQTHFSI